jgi:hypothetical protein
MKKKNEGSELNLTLGTQRKIHVVREGKRTKQILRCLRFNGILNKWCIQYNYKTYEVMFANMDRVAYIVENEELK